jgi:ribosome-associated protein
MDIRKLQRAIVDGLEDVKAQNIEVFDTEHISALFERVIVASGTSNRQTRALASSVRDAIKQQGFPLPRMEGEENGEWIIVDCGAAVVHVMQPSIREYYHLEELWGEKPVMLSKPLTAKKVAANKPAAVKKTAAKKAAVKTVAVQGVAVKKTAASKKVATKSTTKTTTESAALPAKKVAAKKSTVRSAVTRTVGVKSSSVAKTVAVKKPVAKKTSSAK